MAALEMGLQHFPAYEDICRGSRKFCMNLWEDLCCLGGIQVASVKKNDRNHNWVGSHIFHRITICARRSQREGPQPSPITRGTTPSPGKALRGCILSLQPRAFCRWLGTSLLCSVLSPAICLLGMISPPGCRAMGFVVPLHISGLHSLSWLLLEVS